MLGAFFRLRPSILSPLLLGLALVGTSCQEDPHDAQTWIDKLDDQRELKTAVRNLIRLKDPRAIKPLGEVWRKYNKESSVLRAMITIASWEGTGEEGAEKVDPHYDEIKEFLEEAVNDFDPGDEGSRGDAGVACDALGKAKIKDTVPTLIKAATKPVPRLSPANRVRIACIRALGNFDDPRAVDTLITIIEADVESQRIQLFGAAALSLAKTGPPKALPALMTGLFALPIYSQLRTAITRVGKDAVFALIAVQRGKNKAVQAMAKSANFADKAPGQIVFKTSMLLGDMRATAATKMLIARLKQQPVTSYFNPRSGAPGPKDHEGVLRALQNIGDPKAASAVYDYAFGKKPTFEVQQMKARAIDVYSWLARDKKALDKLGKMIKDENQEDQLWFAAVIAYGRIATTSREAKLLRGVQKKYQKLIDLADKKLKKAKGPDQRSPIEAGKRVNEGYRNALRDSVHRIQVATQCKKNPSCYTNTLDAKDIRVGKPGVPRVERAMLELYQMGTRAEAVTDKLLDHAGSSERIVREGINLALPRIAPKPCPKCVDKLAVILKEQSNQTTMDALNKDTQIVYHYFLWAGK